MLNGMPPTSTTRDRKTVSNNTMRRVPKRPRLLALPLELRKKIWAICVPRERDLDMCKCSKVRTSHIMLEADTAREDARTATLCEENEKYDCAVWSVRAVHRTHHEPTDSTEKRVRKVEEYFGLLLAHSDIYDEVLPLYQQLSLRFCDWACVKGFLLGLGPVVKQSWNLKLEAAIERIQWDVALSRYEYDLRPGMVFDNDEVRRHFEDGQGHDRGEYVVVNDPSGWPIFRFKALSDFVIRVCLAKADRAHSSQFPGPLFIRKVSLTKVQRQRFS